MSSIAVGPGTVIGRDFRVVRHLASGAMGAVYIVDQLSTGKQRALKVMSLEIASNERARERFVLEARVGAKIESDHVVEVVSAGIDEQSGAPYMVMELLKGEELADHAHRRGPLPLSEVAEIFGQAGHALEKAHAQGIVHRDIKPENLFIAESRRKGVPFTVKILDFGIAKLVAERTVEGTQPVGTPLFMSPEQTDRRGLIAPTTDVWPLGLLAFFLLTGRHYWLASESGITSLLREVVMEPLVPASQRAAELGCAELLPPGFDAWFAGCVVRDPSGRFAEAGACVRAFQQLAAALGASDVKTLVRPPPQGLEVAATVGAAPGTLDTAGSGALGVPGTGPLAYDGVAQPARLASTGDATAVTAATEAKGAGGRATMAVAALLAGALLGVSGWFLTRDDDDPTPAAPPLPTAAATASEAPAADGSSCPDGMVWVKGGAMFMGSTDKDLGDEVRPPHKVSISSFCLDQKEVTAGAYQQCVDQGHCLRAHARVAFEGLTEKAAPHYSALCNVGKESRADHPINCVTWSMAKQFCEGEGARLAEGGARLPTEAEWEYAARGSGQRIYPWGDDDPGPKLLNACGDECVAWLEASALDVYGQMYQGDDGYPATAPVGSFPSGASSAGVLDLAGNVWEWTGDWYAPYGSEALSDPQGPEEGEERVVRGGGFNGLKPSWAKPAYRWKTQPDTRSHGIGFRCAKAPSTP